MFDTHLIITYLVLTSFTSYLFTLSLSINIKRLSLFFHLLSILTDFSKFRPPSFIRHLRVAKIILQGYKEH